MSSSRKRRSEPTDTFFLDRGLGRHHVANVIRDAGLAVVHMSEIYENDGQHVDDDEWIHRVAEQGWVGLTKDAVIARFHREAFESSGIRMFALSNANITGPKMAERVSRNLNRIRQRAEKRGPYLYVIHQDGLE